jgi:DNA-binding transcriptional regulator YiaG
MGGEYVHTLRMKSIMVLHGDTSAVLAGAIGVSPQTFSAKINERNGAEFTQGEISKIRERYNLSPEEIDSIFFKEKVS